MPRFGTNKEKSLSQGQLNRKLELARRFQKMPPKAHEIDPADLIDLRPGDIVKKASTGWSVVTATETIAPPSVYSQTEPFIDVTLEVPSIGTASLTDYAWHSCSRFVGKE